MLNAQFRSHGGIYIGRSISSENVLCTCIISILHFHAITDGWQCLLQFHDLLHVVVALYEIHLTDWIAADEFQLAVTKVENCIPVTN